MSEEQSGKMNTSGYASEVTPESMMSDFRGRPIIGILGVTVIVHVILVGVFSVGYLKNELLGEDTSSLSEEERMDVAVREATASLREIAERHGVSPQDLTKQFADGKARDSATPTNPEMPPGSPTATTPDTETPKSAIEKELDKVEKGPELPPALPKDEDDLFKKEDDLF